MAGAICPKILMEKVANILGMQEVTIGYGLTEISPLAF